jgi:transcription-repair coupling factor (superfamily II helicase)
MNFTSQPSATIEQFEQYSPLQPPVPHQPQERIIWSQLQDASSAVAVAETARQTARPLLVIVPDTAMAQRFITELAFFLTGSDSSKVAQPSCPILRFPDWEILPYDLFAPLPEIISERLLTLYQLPTLQQGILVVPVNTILQRLPPRDYVHRYSFVMSVGDHCDFNRVRYQLERAGYQCVSQVMTHGEFAIRGALLDIFPMGHKHPLRFDLLDDVVESIRIFDPETQRSGTALTDIRLLPAREYPLSADAITQFKQRYQATIQQNPAHSVIYQTLSSKHIPAGLEAYLPLFFDHTETLFDYLPTSTLVIEHETVRATSQRVLDDIHQRYEQRRHDPERPLLAPRQIYLDDQEFAAQLNAWSGICWHEQMVATRRKGYRSSYSFATRSLPALDLHTDKEQSLSQFLHESSQRVLFVAESPGRRAILAEQLQALAINPVLIDDWDSFVHDTAPYGLVVAPLERPLWLTHEQIVLITETQLHGDRVKIRQVRQHDRSQDTVVRHLAELHEGDPVVHEQYGIGRFLGLQNLVIDGIATEFLILAYAQQDKLYVPVNSLHLISRYTGGPLDQAPLHRLGTEQWDKAKRKAAQRAHDVAAELLDIQARRAARVGRASVIPQSEYARFAAAFEFDPTPDQQRAIDAILADMASTQPMDRVVCGDVGFGKTEVAMRAAFVAVHNGYQVAVLVPTTLLVQQHLQNFADRFADWPVRITGLSRFRTTKEQQTILGQLADGQIDIIIGTHKLLQPEIRIPNLGLVIVDEEHRFGVRHKERLKNLRSDVDILTLTATPIPRTLNMALGGLRDLSIIATPPIARHPIKTFIAPWNDALIQESCQREIHRGGQIYFLHNDIETIHAMAATLATLIPTAKINIAHGQMRERELERVMRDFYHQRFNLLVCTTIIESGLDIPTANTILIHRADRLGLAQLHQLRGRVGRSHHRAYAYLIVPERQAMTIDAQRRLEALSSLEELGAGFTLATHDLEIRGAGELLGQEQSGQIHEIGFNLYMDFLARAVAALKAGLTVPLDRPLDHGPEIDLGVPALLPEDYVPDIHTRLILYKRIAGAADKAQLQELTVEMIDRFGLLPEPAKRLLQVTELKLTLLPLGVKKLDIGAEYGRMILTEQTCLDPQCLVQLLQRHPQTIRFDPAKNTLKFSGSFQQPEQRLAAITQLINELTMTSVHDA